MKRTERLPSYSTTRYTEEDHWFEVPIDAYPGRLFTTRMPRGVDNQQWEGCEDAPNCHGDKAGEVRGKVNLPFGGKSGLKNSTAWATDWGDTDVEALRQTIKDNNVTTCVVLVKWPLSVALPYTLAILLRTGSCRTRCSRYCIPVNLLS